MNSKKPYDVLGRLIAENEDYYEDDAGEIMYFDPYKSEWLPLVGGR